MKIFDTSSLISIFGEAKYPKILTNCTERGYKLVIPETVYNELTYNERTFAIFANHKELFEIRNVKRECLESLSARYPYLHHGELGVICVALEEERRGRKHICILDEKKARNFCKKNQIRIAGLIGLLVWQKSCGDLNHSECEAIHKNLNASRFNIERSILDELIK